MVIQVKRLSGDDSPGICLVPKRFFRAFNLSKEVSYNIHAGQIAVISRVNISKSDESTLFIPGNLFDNLLIPDGLTLNIRVEGSDIYLGPVVGIFLNYTWFPDFEDGSKSKYDGRAALQEHCLCYYFSINNILWDENKVWGYTLSHESGNWVSGWFPLPDVIYDRAVHFKIEEKPLAKEIRSRLKSNPGVSFINTCDYIGKWETYKRLSKYPEICQYLPKTAKYSSFNDVIMMLKQHEFIFLKSYYGSGGTQVLSIEKEKRGYKLVFYSGGLKEMVIKDIEELRNKVEEFTEGSKFIIQEGIRLLKYNNRVFDMRVMIAKNGKGKWKVVENYARVAKANYTITNISAGGDDNFYRTIYPSLKSPYCTGKIPDYEEVGAVTLTIAEYLEKAFGRMGDIGMDIAIDIYGRIWFIEANAKQDREPEEGLDDLEKIPPHCLVIFEYSRYLAGF